MVTPITSIGNFDKWLNFKRKKKEKHLIFGARKSHFESDRYDCVKPINYASSKSSHLVKVLLHFHFVI